MVPCLPWVASSTCPDVIQACVITILVLFLQYPLFLLSRHVLEDCMAVEACRVREGIRAFLSACRGAGWSRAASFRFYVTGRDKDGLEIAKKDHLLRGASLTRLTDAWLNVWK